MQMGKKTRKSKQKYCCRWLRSCILRKKKKFQRNCTDGPKNVHGLGKLLENMLEDFAILKQLEDLEEENSVVITSENVKEKNVQQKEKDVISLVQHIQELHQVNVNGKLLKKHQKEYTKEEDVVTSSIIALIANVQCLKKNVNLLDMK